MDSIQKMPLFYLTASQMTSQKKIQNPVFASILYQSERVSLRMLNKPISKYYLKAAP
jgi:hypothetical protein